jgi:hypothetical protein
MQINILERAFQIAATGKCDNVTQIIEVLKREGYASANSYFAGGRSLRNDLKKVIERAKAARTQSADTERASAGTETAA